MPLESCMILLDCSEYMRNGDYVPSRLEAQQDAANLLVGAKTQSHQESTVGIAAGTELLLSPTHDVGKILSAIHGLAIHSTATTTTTNKNNSNNNNNNKQLQQQHLSDITAAVQVASLALKHRRNKNGAQRIVLFVGTPLSNHDTRALQKAGRQLKKNNVAIDVIAMGELEENEPKLRELVDAANGNRGTTSNNNNEVDSERTCHLVTVPTGVLPSDVLANSPVLSGVGALVASTAVASSMNAAAGGAAASNHFAEFGGVDPNMDPELAMALRVSMEEERARQERVAAAAAASATTTTTGGGGGDETKQDHEMADANDNNTAGGMSSMAAEVGLSEEEALLQQALAMSMNENDPPATATTTNDETTATAAAATNDQQAMDMDEDNDDAAMQLALQMSMQADTATATTATNQQTSFQDPAFVQELVGTNPELQEAVRQSQQQQQNNDDDDNNNNNKKKDGDQKPESKK